MCTFEAGKTECVWPGVYAECAHVCLRTRVSKFVSMHKHLLVRAHSTLAAAFDKAKCITDLAMAALTTARRQCLLA